MLSRMASAAYLPAALAGAGATLLNRSLSAYESVPTLTPGLPSTHPLVSIVVSPGSIADLKTVVPGLAGLAYQNREIVVVGPSSDPDLVRLADAYGARVVDPVGGVNSGDRSLTAAADASRGEWLLFVHPRTIHCAESLSAVLALAIDEKLDVLSVVPVLDRPSVSDCLAEAAWRSSLFAGLVKGSVNRSARSGVVDARYVLVSRPAYRSMGGHEVTGGQIGDDRTFGTAMSRSGLRVGLYRSGAAIRYRPTESGGRAIARAVTRAARPNSLGPVASVVRVVAILTPATAALALALSAIGIRRGVGRRGGDPLTPAIVSLSLSAVGMAFGATAKWYATVANSSSEPGCAGRR